MPLIGRSSISWIDKQIFLHADANLEGAFPDFPDPAEWPTSFGAVIVAIGEHSLKETLLDPNSPEDILKFAKMHAQDKNFQFADGGETSTLTPMASLLRSTFLREKRISSVTWGDVFEVLSATCTTKATKEYDFLACEAQYMMPIRDHLHDSKVDNKATIGGEVQLLSPDDWHRLTTLPTIISLIEAIRACESNSIGMFVRLNQAEQLSECLAECGAVVTEPLAVKIYDARRILPPIMGRMHQIHDLPENFKDLVRREIEFRPEVYVSGATLRYTAVLIHMILTNGLELPGSVYVDSEFGYLTIGFPRSRCSLVVDNWLVTFAKHNGVVFDELNLLNPRVIENVEKELQTLLRN